MLSRLGLDDLNFFLESGAEGLTDAICDVWDISCYAPIRLSISLEMAELVSATEPTPKANSLFYIPLTSFSAIV